MVKNYFLLVIAFLASASMSMSMELQKSSVTDPMTAALLQAKLSEVELLINNGHLNNKFDTPSSFYLSLDKYLQAACQAKQNPTSCIRLIFEESKKFPAYQNEGANFPINFIISYTDHPYSLAVAQTLAQTYTDHPCNSLHLYINQESNKFSLQSTTTSEQ